ncbi:hypothetical protein TYRP_013552 [Tyrophagus putrescentiae]|nr:hypothetical protein TYRP_013552 [Tyrophagus putrescentiae]
MNLTSEEAGDATENCCCWLWTVPRRRADGRLAQCKAGAHSEWLFKLVLVAVVLVVITFGHRTRGGNVKTVEQDTQAHRLLSVHATAFPMRAEASVCPYLSVR